MNNCYICEVTNLNTNEENICFASFLLDCHECLGARNCGTVDGDFKTPGNGFEIGF